MEWQWVLLLFFGSFIVLFIAGIPFAFCFLILNIGGVFLFWGGQAGLNQLATSFFASIGTFTLVPVPLFILMGDVMFRSKLAPNMINALDKWIGRVPGRLSLLAVGGGTVFAALSGSSIAGVCLLGSTLGPEMEKKGYKKSMIFGPILGSGGLATLIPPSGLAVLLASIAEISIARTLMAIIIPGILLAGLFAAYIILRCHFQPSLAPSYNVTPTSLREKIRLTAKYILPLSFIVFLVIGLIFLGIASPTEASALGALGTFALTAVYKQLNWKMVKESISSTVEITVMVFMIILGAKVFAQILAFTGVSQGMVRAALGLSVHPIFIIIIMQVVVLFLGAFMEVVSIMMLTMPIFIPVVLRLNFDPVWFATIIMVNVEVAMISPPFGTSLFAMKGVASPDTTMGDIWMASFPFMGLFIIAMGLIMVFPQLALWLPGITG